MRARAQRRPAAVAHVALLAAALRATLVACGPSSVTSGAADIGNAVPAQDFVGDWAGADFMIDGTWDGTSGTFTVFPGNQGGGIVIAQTASGLTAQFVGTSGTSTPAFPAMLHVDTLSFSVPDASGTPVTLDVQIVDPTSNMALLQVGTDSADSWDLEQVPQIPTG